MAGMVAYSPVVLLQVLNYHLERNNLMFVCLFAFGCGTGGRITELLSARRSTLLYNGKIRDTIRLTKLKTRSEKEVFREVPWLHQLDPYISAWLQYQQEHYALELPEDFVFSKSPGKPITRLHAWKVLKKGYDDLGLTTRHGTHGMRKFYGLSIYTYYNKKYSDQLKALEMTRLALGHGQIDTTIRYLNIVTEDFREALADVFSFLPTGNKISKHSISAREITKNSSEFVSNCQKLNERGSKL